MEGEKATSSKINTRVRTDYLSFLAFLEAGQIKVSRVLNWGPVPHSPNVQFALSDQRLV